MSLRERLNHLRSQRGDGERPGQTGRTPVAERVARLRGGGHDAGETAAGPQALASAVGGEPVAPGLVRVTETDPGVPMPDPQLLGHLPEAAGLDAERVLFLDTETTGLAGGTGTVAFLVGVAWPGSQGLVTTQLLLTGMAGEAAMLDALADVAAGATAVVTYNGKRFDGPLLATRYRLHDRPSPFGGLPHLDLLYPVRRLYRRRWPDCRLVTAEQRLLGRERERDLPGSEAPEAWRAFLRSGRPGQVPAVARHNREDIRSLAALLPALASGHRAPRPTGADPLAAARARLAEGDEAVARALLTEQADQLGRDGRLELARLHRRAGEDAAARALWQGLAEQGCPRAIEHLAKHFEHRLRDPATALAWAERLPPGLAHDRRRQRLRDKCGAGPFR